MKLPRHLSGEDLIQALKKLGYTKTRQTGSHIRLTTIQGGEHHITIPNHLDLRIGTLSNILSSVSIHFKLGKEELLRKLF